jgi:hypothetical protein
MKKEKEKKWEKQECDEWDKRSRRMMMKGESELD